MCPHIGLHEVAPVGRGSRGLSGIGFKLPNGHNDNKRAIIDVNSIVSVRNYVLTSIIARLLTSRPFDDMSLFFHQGLANSVCRAEIGSR